MQPLFRRGQQHRCGRSSRALCLHVEQRCLCPTGLVDGPGEGYGGESGRWRRRSNVSVPRWGGPGGGSNSRHDNAVAEARRKALGDLNWDKLVSRWGEYLRSRDQRVLTSLRAHILEPQQHPAESPGPRVEPTRTAAVYTPYALRPGGGESYLLTLAAILAARYRVSIVTPHRYSSLRLRNLGGELRIDLSALHLITEEELLKTDSPDLMVTMGNYILPGIEGRGKTNIYLCQFPFHMDAARIHAQRSLLDNYGTILVYSDYARAHLYAGLSAHRLPPKPITVLHPPVQQIAGDATSKKNIILSVGRFFVGSHSKRHDALIATFKSIAFRFDQPVELHLAGSSTPEPQHIDYMAQLMASAQGFPIHFHVNPSSEQLHQLYRDAAVYWHGTGIGADLVVAPEKAEHFGISLVEAMSAEAVPFSLAAGGAERDHNPRGDRLPLRHARRVGRTDARSVCHDLDRASRSVRTGRRMPRG